MKVGLISDTHVPARAHRLPAKVLEIFLAEKVEAILHAGDIERMEVLEELSAIAPVTAVAGNMDGRMEMADLPECRVVVCGQYHIGLAHGWGSPQGIVQRILERFGKTRLDILVYGHTHHPADEVIRGVRAINPGSTAGNYVLAYPTAGILDLDGEVTFRVVAVS